jgi:hypothetical protein
MISSYIAANLYNIDPIGDGSKLKVRIIWAQNNGSTSTLLKVLYLNK